MALSYLPARAIFRTPIHLADTTMFWSRESGGVKRYLDAKHRYIEQLGRYRHTIVAPGTLTADPPQVPGVPLPFSTGYRLPRSRRSAARVLTKLHPDLIEAGDPYQLAWATLDAGQEMGIPVVAFYHSDIPALATQVFGEHAGHAACAYVRKLYSQFDAVLAPSLCMVEKLENMQIPNVVHQPLGVDTSLFHPRHRDPLWRSRIGVAANCRVLIYVGRYAPEKNLQILCDAVKKLGGSHVLVTIGSGPCLPQGSHVINLPYEGNTRILATAIASADVLVHAGDQETFGLVALEAMASGIPVIASRRGGLGELVDESVGYAVEHQDANQFAEAIAAVAERDPLFFASSTRARARAYDWQKIFPKMLRRYRQLIGKTIGKTRSPLLPLMPHSTESCSSSSGGKHINHEHAF